MNTGDQTCWSSGTSSITKARRQTRAAVRVVAASVNIYDWHMTTGTPYLARVVAGLTRPKYPIPGADVAGIVEAVGSHVVGVEVGDEVFGDIGRGAFAEFASVNPRAIARKPSGVSFAQAVGQIPLAALTALQGLRDVAGIQSGHRVLVNGASGGVGTFAVQIAKALGAEVTAVCSTGKVDMVRSIGANEVIDYTRDDYTRTERGYDVLFDNVGNRPWRETSRVLRSDGISVSVTGPSTRSSGHCGTTSLGSWRRGSAAKERMTWFTAHVSQDDLETLAGFYRESGAIAPVIERTYPLDQLPVALSYLGEGRTIGKVVIDV